MAAGAMCPKLLDALPSKNDGRRLILVELKGGNDGLNTLVPFKNKDYQRIRKNLHLKPNQINVINDELGLGLHNSLEFLHSEFKRKKVAVFHSVGYEDPNMSHFRGIDIWDTAVESGDAKSKGWIADALESNVGSNAISKGIILGDHNMGPLRGTAQKVLVVDNIKKMLKSQKLFESQKVKGNKALRHILTIENQVLEQLKGFSGVDFEPKKNKGFESDINVLLQLVKADPKIPFFKLTLGSFDTHTNQLPQQSNLLSVLDKGLKTLVAELIKMNQYDNTLILTYSEFGRRPMENGNRGTDHGTANCQFALGGKVTGRIYHGPDGKGKPGQAGSGGYDLSEIKSNEQTLKAKMDFKDIYQTILTNWWGIDGLEGERKAINFLKS